MFSCSPPFAVSLSLFVPHISSALRVTILLSLSFALRATVLLSCLSTIVSFACFIIMFTSLYTRDGFGSP
ncbi:hypothetical protein EDC04DRAFT_2624915 [Pisolithus marmoratus]|nr:hypothetical protein EDC04DRAFT_2624915 [Pisolithus marmoratus]